MTVAEFETALAKACPEDRKVVATITSEWVTFSSVPRNKDNESMPTCEFVTSETEIREADDSFLDKAKISLGIAPIPQAKGVVPGVSRKRSK